MKNVAVLLVVLAISGQGMSWSLNDYIVGKYVLTTNKATDDFAKLMEFLEFKPEDIKAAKEHPTSGNIGIKSLDDTEGKRSIEWTMDSPVGDNKVLIMKEKEKFEAKCHDGRAYHGTPEFPSESELKVTGVLADGNVTCVKTYKFEKVNMHIQFHCTNKKDEKLDIKLEYKRA